MGLEGERLNDSSVEAKDVVVAEGFSRYASCQEADLSSGTSSFIGFVGRMDQTGRSGLEEEEEEEDEGVGFDGDVDWYLFEGEEEVEVLKEDEEEEDGRRRTSGRGAATK